MKPKFWHTKEFKELETKWYCELKKEKFNDIEERVNGTPLLRQRSNNSYGNASQIERENKLRYYELLGRYVHEEAFEDGIEQLIMQRKANGTTITLICKELEQMNERCYRGTVRKIIQKFEAKWKIKRR